MITEHALLPVISGQEEDFEEAFERARLIVASMPGFVSLSLSRSIETPSTYLLLVQWDTLEDHTVGFRGSPQHQQWRELLHRFYEPFSLVEHYELVNSAPR
jgi:heme-degrading monooxygenase HmoA